ncbi:MAG: hypothetical protein KAT34_01645 [Candidatus Aminicenantes bacterium]|nr:hypothetical protein [Candidatus Aminicenantes bacterium]
MKKKSIFRFLIPVLLLCTGTGLYGEDFFKLKKGISDNAWKKIAFFYLTPALTLENLGYISNIYYYQELEEPDWTADIGLDLLVSVILGNRFVLSLKEKPYYSFYAEHVDQRALNNRLKTSMYSYLGRLNLEYSYSNDYIKGRPTAEFGAHIRLRTDEHFLSVDYGSYKNLFLNLFLKQNSIEHYEENYLGNYNLKQFMNRKELHAGIRLNKNIFTRTRLFVGFEYYEYKFAKAPLRDGIGRQVSLGVAFPEIGRIRGSVEFGVKHFQPGSSLYRKYTKPFGSGEVTIRLLRRFKFDFQYLVNNFYSYWSVEQSFDERSAGSRVEYYIAKNIKIGYNYQLGILSYENLHDGKKTRRDNFYTSAVYIGLRVFEKMGIGLEYRMYRADSDMQAFSRSSNFIGGYLIHEF